MANDPLTSPADDAPGFIPPGPPQRLPRFWRSHRGMVQALASVLALVAAVGFVVLPWLSRGLAEEALSGVLQRRVGIERILFNPFALTLELRGVEARDANGDKVAGFASLYADVAVWRSLGTGRATLAEIMLRAPYLRVVRQPDGRLDWDDVLAVLATPDAPPSAAPPRFVLENITVEEGELLFDDRLFGRSHALRGLMLSVPVLDSQPDHPDPVEMRLSARLNDSRLELKGRARPFAAEADAAFELALNDLDLAPLQAYLPSQRPVLHAGRLDLRVQAGLTRPADAGPQFKASGGLVLKTVDLQDRDGQPLLGFERLRIEFGDFDLRARRLEIRQIQLDAPRLNLRRDENGQFDLAAMLSEAAAGSAAGDPGSGAPPAFALSIERIAWHDGQIRFRDDAVAGGFSTVLQGIDLQLQDLAWPARTPARLTLTLAGEGQARLALDSQLDLRTLSASGELRASGWPLGAWQPYYAPALRGLRLEAGALNLEAGFEFAGLAADAAHRVSLRRLSVEDLALSQPTAPVPFLRLAAVELTGAEIHPASRQARIERLSLSAPRLELVRLASGELDVLVGLGPTAPASDAPKAASPAWRVELAQLQLGQGRARIEDRSLAQPLRLALDALELEAGPLSLDPATRTRFRLDTRIDRQGQLQGAGEFQLEPLQASLALDLQRLELLPLQGLLPDALALRQGTVSARGQLRLARKPDGGLLGDYSGEAALEDFALLDRGNHSDLLRWGRLALTGIDARLSPPAVAIEQLSLRDFHAQLILDAGGQLNLRTIAAARQAAPDKAASAEASRPRPTGVATLPFALRLGKAVFSNGQVQFSDRFIRPNFDADLHKLDGEFTELDSTSDRLARLSISGELGAGAPMAVSGELNPFRRDAYLDIRATVRDYELTPASPYTARYVGHGIEKGKLSAELNYQVRERQLSASNRIRLDQLTLGERGDSPDALNLPIKLAVALLKNSRGEIDLDLPIAGTLDDPQFSVGGLIMQAVMNLLVKTVTAPFRMLAALFGGGETLESVEFPPGSAQLDAVAVNKLGGLARALAERPGLRLEITGQVDPQSDAEGLARQGLLNRLRALKAREERRDADRPIEFGDADYPVWLERLYREADIDKPRNLVGLTRKLSVAEMEALLLAAYPPLPTDFDALSRQRANAVKEWLIGPGKVEPERLYLRASHEADRGEGLNRAAFSLR